MNMKTTSCHLTGELQLESQLIAIQKISKKKSITKIQA